MAGLKWGERWRGAGGCSQLRQHRAGESLWGRFLSRGLFPQLIVRGLALGDVSGITSVLVKTPRRALARFYGTKPRTDSTGKCEEEMSGQMEQIEPTPKV